MREEVAKTPDYTSCTSRQTHSSFQRVQILKFKCRSKICFQAHNGRLSRFYDHYRGCLWQLHHPIFSVVSAHHAFLPVMPVTRDAQWYTWDPGCAANHVNIPCGNWRWLLVRMQYKWECSCVRLFTILRIDNLAVYTEEPCLSNKQALGQKLQEEETCHSLSKPSSLEKLTSSNRNREHLLICLFI